MKIMSGDQELPNQYYLPRDLLSANQYSQPEDWLSTNQYYQPCWKEHFQVLFDKSLLNLGKHENPGHVFEINKIE